MGEDWRNTIESDRRQSHYGIRRKTRVFGRWMFFVPDWLFGLTIVVLFDRPWGRQEPREVTSGGTPVERGRLYVFQYKAQRHFKGSYKTRFQTQPHWFVLEKDPRHSADPVRGPILFNTPSRRPPLVQAARLLQARIEVKDAAERLGWDGKTVSD